VKFSFARVVVSCSGASPIPVNTACGVAITCALSGSKNANRTSNWQPFRFSF
jgi:hypothetical protein